MTYIALEALGDHPVVAKIQGALQGLQAKMPDLTGNLRNMLLISIFYNGLPADLYYSSKFRL